MACEAARRDNIRTVTSMPIMPMLSASEPGSGTDAGSLFVLGVIMLVGTVVRGRLAGAESSMAGGE
jgi:hypothetical protein